MSIPIECNYGKWQKKIIIHKTFFLVKYENPEERKEREQRSSLCHFLMNATTGSSERIMRSCQELKAQRFFEVRLVSFMLGYVRLMRLFKLTNYPTLPYPTLPYSPLPSPPLKEPWVLYFWHHLNNVKETG